MKIQLVESEIQEALQQYLKGIITITEDKKLNIDILATRGANGVTAEVTIDSSGSKEEVNVVEPVKVIEPSFELPKTQVEEVKSKKSLFAGLSN